MTSTGSARSTPPRKPPKPRATCSSSRDRCTSSDPPAAGCLDLGAEGDAPAVAGTAAGTEESVVDPVGDRIRAHAEAGSDLRGGELAGIQEPGRAGPVAVAKLSYGVDTECLPRAGTQACGIELAGQGGVVHARREAAEISTLPGR